MRSGRPWDRAQGQKSNRKGLGDHGVEGGRERQDAVLGKASHAASEKASTDPTRSWKLGSHVRAAGPGLRAIECRETERPRGQR